MNQRDGNLLDCRRVPIYIYSCPSGISISTDHESYSCWSNNLSRVYHLEIARHVAGAEQRWVENLLTRFDLPGVESVGQGTARRISNLGIYHVALVARLVQSIGISLEPASALAIRLLAEGDGQPVAVLGELELRFDRAAFVASIDSLIADAAEATVPPRRGRPPAAR